LNPSAFRCPNQLFLLLFSVWGLFGCDVVVNAGPGNEPQGCRQGEALCDGLVRKTCSADGSWLTAETCASACSEGRCTGVCELGESRCNGLVPQSCDADGAWRDGAACDFVCSAGSCTGVCAPGSATCDGAVPQTCGDDGTWRSGQACALGCSDGACIDACELGTVRCQGLVPQVCGEDGWHEGAACEFACHEGQCTGVCAPGASRCDGLVPQTCSDAGAWVAGQACDFVCRAGACIGRCVPGSHRCADTFVVENCDANGAWRPSTCSYFCSDLIDACACPTGFEGDGAICTPIDFCSAPNGGCSPRATCSQNGTLPSCVCDIGTTGDGYSCSFAPTRVFDEGFDDITQLASSNWAIANRSEPRGNDSWFQGVSVQAGGPFDSYDGSPNSFISANFNSAQGNDATISSWLASPSVFFGPRAAVSFYTRSSSGTPRYADRIEVRLCSTMPCYLPDDAGVGSYTTLLGSVNPNLVADGYPDTWTKLEFTNAEGIPYSGEGRVAIRYYVTDAGMSGANSNIIGVDRFVGAFATPSFTVGGSVAGLTSGSVVLWLNGREKLTVAANGSFRFPPRLDGGTPYSVRVFAQPNGHACTVANASGIIGAADVGNVQVNCSAK